MGTCHKNSRIRFLIFSILFDTFGSHPDSASLGSAFTVAAKFDYPQVVSMFIPLTCGIVTALWVRRWLTDWIDCETTNEVLGCSENVFLDHERKQAGSAPVRSLIIVPPQRSGSRPVGSGYIGAPHRALSSSYPLVTIQVGRP